MPVSETIDVGVIVIGRNEGERLRLCLASVMRLGRHVVYVDSGSTDGSVELARAMSAEVVELVTADGFTAARARNAGFDCLLKCDANVRFVQFVDGDCVVDAGWIDSARVTLEQLPNAAVVCGRRRERYPDASIFNRLCDMEWDTTVGEASECGGDAMMRVEAFRTVGGFNGELIAGEEPELCVRLRAAGWTVQRRAAEMTLHDAAMTRFSQWWNRNVRAGHAFAEGSAMHGSSPLRHWVRQTRSNWVWGFVVPLLMIIAAVPTRGVSLIVLAGLYLLLMVKVHSSAVRRGRAVCDARLFGVFCVLGKVPQAVGQLKYHIGRWIGRRSGLIEYKAAPVAAISG